MNNNFKQIYLLLTEDCNLSCSFCIRGAKTHSSFNLEVWRTIMKYNDFSAYSLLITGGEPTISKFLNETISSSINNFRTLCVNTNGYDSSWIENLNEKNIHVQISLDGIGNTHNILRSNGQYDVYTRVIETIQKLVTRSISYNISTTVSKRNVSNIYEIMEAISEFPNMKYWKVSMALPFGCNSIQDCIAIDDWNIIVDELIKKSHVKLSIKKLFDFQLLEKFIQKHGKYLPSNLITNCGSVNNKIYIYPDFTIYPCTCLTDFPLGNLTKNKLSEILESSQAKRFSNYTVQKTSSCYTCEYRQYCNGGCIGMSYNIWGELGKGDYRCPLVK